MAWFRRKDVRVREVLTDNGSGCVSGCFGLACSQLKIQHLRTRPYRPCTNGKAERFIQTLMREWAYIRPYRTSGLRARALPIYLAYYNDERPHGDARAMGDLGAKWRSRSCPGRPSRSSQTTTGARGLVALASLGQDRWLGEPPWPNPTITSEMR